MRSIAVEDPWPSNLYWRLQLVDLRVVQCPVTIKQLQELSPNSLVGMCRRAVQAYLREHGPVPPPEHSPAAPDLATTVVGFRSWHLRADGGLGPIGSGTLGWRGAEEVRARCEKAYHAAPGPLPCHCGWNAWHEAWKVKYELASSSLRRVVGAIAARGRMEVHHDGFRAEWARPLCLAYPDVDDASQYTFVGGPGTVPSRGGPPRTATHRDHIERAARDLGLPAVPFSQLEAFAAERGAPVPESLRPPDPARGHGVINVSFSTGASAAATAASIRAVSRRLRP